MSKLKENKSPGLDGLTSEFYIAMWKKIGPLLVEVYNESYNDGLLSKSQRESVLSLLFKKGDSSDLTNYRPISLNNIDYKILSLCLS